MKTQIGKLDPDDINLMKLAQEYSDDDTARGLLESLRWPEGPVCPHCKFDEVYKLTPKPGSRSPARKGLYKCAACRKQFSVMVGTIFSDSHIPIGKWLMAIFILGSSKKAVSAHQLHRMLGLTYKSAWFLAHRLRFAMGPEMPLGKLLKGTVEMDETFVGGKVQASAEPTRPARLRLWR
jgi:transposase-like protein